MSVGPLQRTFGVGMVWFSPLPKLQIWKTWARLAPLRLYRLVFVPHYWAQYYFDAWRIMHGWEGWRFENDSPLQFGEIEPWPSKIGLWIAWKWRRHIVYPYKRARDALVLLCLVVGSA